MENNGFVHLHVHTEFSLLDGSIRIKDLISKTKELGMDSIAITDHGAMFGVVQFYKEALKQGIKPILGCEVYVAVNSYTDKEIRDKNQYHLVLLAETQEGYQNLMKLVSEGYVNGFYYKPRIDKRLLRKYSKGLIALSACLGGEVQQYILDGNYEKAESSAKKYKDIFGDDNFFLELQDHGINEQQQVNQYLKKISIKHNIGLVATNDVHYLTREDASVHDVLLCVQTGKTVDDDERMKFPSDEFYLKSAIEMAEQFPDEQNALLNTTLIAKRCNVELDFKTLHLPSYDVPEGYTKEGYLREICEKGLVERYGTITDKIKQRYEYEFKTIVDMGYVDYFLIVWDFIKYANDNEIMVGPGRGSAAGSIISYALNIIGIDPLKYNLLFERFLNPERITMPDIDIDFCYERREEVIKYVIEKYGADRVAQIATFGTMAARGSIRDVGRALAMPYGEVDYIAKQIPTELGITIDKALEVNKTLKEQYDKDEDINYLINVAKAVEGLPRHTSTHAAGVVISKEPITNYAPLLRNNEAIATQFTMGELEELGLLKMDFLGLRTLTVIRDALFLIEQNHGKMIDIDNIDYEDPKVIELFANAETLGIFQFESAGMRAFLKELKADKFEDLIAANSLYRPGPMNQIPTFVEWKNDPSQVKYLHPSLEDILDVTYGCIVYQEQVMEIVKRLGGYSLGRADLVRRAMGKKKMDVMELERQNFIYGQLSPEGEILVPGAIRNGVDEKSAEKIFNLMIDFANYAFNKSHSAAYALIAFKTAWLKLYYPVEYMAALISSVMSSSTSVSKYIQECKRMGIEVLPPHINKSCAKFTVEGKSIRFGLSAVRNVGASFISSIVKAREKGQYTGFVDFIERVDRIDSSSINKRAIESLIKAGSLSGLGANRAQLLASYDKLIDSTQNDRKNNLEGQFSLFGEAEAKLKEKYPDIADFKQNIILQMEKEMLGIYVSGHPLQPYEREVKMYSTITTAEFDVEIGSHEFTLLEQKDGQKTTIVGLITKTRTLVTKNNNMMAFITIEDLYGEMECIVFPATFDKNQKFIQEDNIVLIEGRLSISDVEQPKIIVEKIGPLNRSDVKRVYIKLDSEKETEKLERVKEILQKHPGDVSVYIYFNSSKRTIKTSELLNVSIEDGEVIEELRVLLGMSSVKVNI